MKEFGLCYFSLKCDNINLKESYWEVTFCLWAEKLLEHSLFLWQIRPTEGGHREIELEVEITSAETSHHAETIVSPDFLPVYDKES